MIARSFDAGTVLQDDAENGLHAVFRNGDHPGGSTSIVRAVIHFEADEAAFDDGADGNRTEGCGDGRVERLARMRLRALVRAGGLLHLPGVGIDEVVALGGALHSVDGEQPRVEPLRRVGSAHLPGEHVAHLVVEGLGVFLRGEVLVLLPQSVQVKARRWKTWRASDSPRVGLGARGRRCRRRAVAVTAAVAVAVAVPCGPAFHPVRGRPSTAAIAAAAGTPRLRKYFWARMSVAICDHWVGTTTLSWWKMTVPSGLRISEVRGSKDMPE